MSTHAALSSPQTELTALTALGAELIARDRWTRERLLELQRARLKELISHVVTASPYYRETLGRHAAEAPLEELPTLPKATLVDEFDRIVTDPRLRSADLEAHLEGPEAASLFLGEYFAFATSGTTGLRGLIVYNESEFDHWVAVSLRLFARVGITASTRLVAIGAPHPLHITRRLFLALGSGRSGMPRLSVLTPMDEIVDALNAYRPEAMITYASIAALLAQEQLEGRLHIEPRIVWVSSEVLTTEARGRIVDAWGVQPMEVYGSTETLYIASSTPPLPDMRIHEDLAVVEVVDERNQPVPARTHGYKVLVTNLVNRTQPLIRYELSDSIMLADGPDPAGLPQTDRPHRRAERRHHQAARDRGRRGGRPPVSTAIAVLRARRGASVPDRP